MSDREIGIMSDGSVDPQILERVHPKHPVKKYSGIEIPECHVNRLFLKGPC